MRQVIATFILTLFASSIIAQQLSADQIIADIAEDMATDGDLSESTQEDLANLMSLAENKIDINHATREELSQLFFLSESQIESLLHRRDIIGTFQTPQELQTIRGFGYNDVLRLICFVDIIPEYVEARRDILKEVIVSRIQRSWPKAKGYKAKNDSTSAPYLGSPYKVYFRNQLSYGTHWKSGIIAEKDPGEPSFSHGISTLDFVSGFVQYTNTHSLLRNAVIGHYSMGVGQGLGLWTGFSRDASSIQTSICRMANGFNGTYSASESGYFRGGAVCVGTDKANLTLFVSHTDGDVSTTENDDSLKYAQTIQTDGYHRTISEVNDRNNFQQLSLGGYTDFSFQKVRATIGYNHWHGSLPIAASDELYKQFYPIGKEIGTLHADYKWFAGSFQAYGEVVWQTTNTFAATQGFNVNLLGGNKFSIAYRQFGKRYYTINQNPYSKAGRPGGESGLYMSLMIMPVRKVSILTNVDVYRNKWLTYQKPAPTNGFRTRTTLTVDLSRRSNITLRIRHDEFDDKKTGSKNEMIRVNRTGYKLAFVSSPTEQLKFRSTIEHVHYFETDEKASNGFWISQEVNYQFVKPNVTISALLGHFDTDTYDSRIYPLMMDVPYSMNIPTVSDNGVIAVGRVAWKINSLVQCWLWCNYTRYYDKDQISSGNNLIDASHKLDAKFQVKISLSHMRKAVATNK